MLLVDAIEEIMLPQIIAKAELLRERSITNAIIKVEVLLKFKEPSYVCHPCITLYLSDLSMAKDALERLCEAFEEL